MALEQYGNTTTFNIESVLHKNIKDGEYFNKTCVKLTTFAELVDEASLQATTAAPGSCLNVPPPPLFLLMLSLINLAGPWSRSSSRVPCWHCVSVAFRRRPRRSTTR